MQNYTIREATPDDAAAIITHWLEISNEPENNILTYGSSEVNSDEAVERQKQEEIAAADNAITIIAITDTGRVIGLVGARGGKRLAERHTVGLGIAIVKDWRGQGIGTKMMEFLIDWARNNLVVHRLYLEVFTENARAIHVYEKLGFQHEGCKRKAFLKHGRWRDAYVMAMLFDREN